MTQKERRRRKAAPGKGRAWPFVAASLLFALSRLYLLYGFTPDQSDISWVYIPYALEQEQARVQQTPLYPHHAAQFARVQSEAFARNEPGPEPETRFIEYPPIAVALMQVPKWFVPDVPLLPADAWPANGEIPGYAQAFRTLMALTDAVGFGALLLIVARLFPLESAVGRFERLLVYVVGGHVLGHLLYDRLTIVLGVLVLVAMGLLVHRGLRVWAGLLAWAAAVNYQLSPLVLAPLVAIGSLTAASLAGSWKEVGTALVKRCALMVGLVILLFLPFALYQGSASLGFLLFHGQRGLNTEAVLASIPLLLSFAGHDVQPVGAYNCWNIASSITPALVQLSTPLVVVLVLGTAALLLRAARALDPGVTEPVAVRLGSTFVGYVTVAFAAAIIGSKVFSPQYLLWLVPLVPLIPGRTARWTFVLVAALTTVIFPYQYDNVSSWHQDPVSHDWSTVGPTVLGKLLLAGRNVLFVLFAAAALRATRRTRAAL